MRSMEEGSLNSFVVPSLAIKVPYATPDDLLWHRPGEVSTSAGGERHAGGMGELLKFMDCGVMSDVGVPPNHIGVDQKVPEMCGISSGNGNNNGRGGEGGGGGFLGFGHAPVLGSSFDQSTGLKMNVINDFRGFPEPKFENMDGSEHHPGLVGVLNQGNGIPDDDLGFDMFIRPGSLIFGVHAHGAIVSPAEAERNELSPRGPDTLAGVDTPNRDGDEHTKADRVPRHNAASLLESVAAGNTIEGRLVRTATAALRSGFNSNSSHWSNKSGANRGGQIIPSSYDATGDGLLTIPEGVFGSFNGEISRLEMGTDGKPVSVQVHGLPKGFTGGLLDVASSILDSSAKSVTVRLPWTPQAGTTIVCMYRGALAVANKQRGARHHRDRDIGCHPHPGWREVSAAWALTGGRTSDINKAIKTKIADREIGVESTEWRNTQHSIPAAGLAVFPPRSKPSGYCREIRRRRRSSREGRTRSVSGFLEGTARSVLIANGPMRGLPVGVTLPVLLTPDAELREELLAALLPLEQMMGDDPRGAIMRDARKRRGLRGESQKPRESVARTTATTTTTTTTRNRPQMSSPVSPIPMLGGGVGVSHPQTKTQPEARTGCCGNDEIFSAEAHRRAPGSGLRPEVGHRTLVVIVVDSNRRTRPRRRFAGVPRPDEKVGAPLDGMGTGIRVGIGGRGNGEGSASIPSRRSGRGDGLFVCDVGGRQTARRAPPP